MDPNDQLLKARDAINRGNHSEAQFHLNAAKMAGADQSTIDQMEAQIHFIRHKRVDESLGAKRLSFVAAGIGYLILAVQQPNDWGVGVWLGASLLLVPAIIGMVMGRRSHHALSASQVFWSAWFVGAIAMGVYTLLELAKIDKNIASHRNASDVPLVIIVAICGYAAVAGTVAGLVGRLSLGRSPS